MKKLATLTIVAAALACGKHTTITTLANGSAQCPNGGVLVTGGSGGAQAICNPAPELTLQTPLAVGDVHCPGGGYSMATGLDNGAGGGVAGNGKLEAGEIQATSYVCQNGSGAIVGAMAPPAGAAGTSVLNVSGGAGSATGAGGNAGSVYLSLDSGTNGGHVKVFNTGSVDASFKFPTIPAPSFGATPFNVTANTTVGTQSSNAPGAGVPAGTVFLNTADGQLYVASGTAAAGTLVTGLSVAAGATLTLPGNHITLGGSCVNAGTITGTDVSATQAGAVDLYCADFSGVSGSAITTAGHLPGQSGGRLQLEATGSIWTQGSFDTSGANGPNGGNGGNFDLGRGYPINSIVNTGSIRTSGGDATSGKGGNAGHVSIESGTECDNSGAIDAHGGKGFNSGAAGVRAAGAGGTVYVSAYGYVGPTRNTAAINAAGGSVDASCTPAANCGAGSGGSIQLESWHGLVANSGNLTTTGGASPVASAAGGPGGNITLDDRGGDTTPTNTSGYPYGSILSSGTLDASGGSGSPGGSGGNISLYTAPNDSPMGQEVILYGMSSILAKGGTGGTTGGNGGQVQLLQSTGNQNGTTVPGGAIINAATIDSSGGNGGTGAGGNAGSILLTTQTGNFFPSAPWEVVLNSGSLISSGGTGTSGGQAATVQLFGRVGVINSGSIVARGGNGTSGAGGAVSTVVAGAFNPSLWIEAVNGAITNTGAVDVSGGSAKGATAGGAAGNVVLEAGTTLADSGTAQLVGGAGDATTGTGGNGGQFTAYVLTGAASSVTVAAPAGIAVSGGAAKTPGAPGSVVIDGRNVTATFTH